MKFGPKVLGLVGREVLGLGRKGFGLFGSRLGVKFGLDSWA